MALALSSEKENNRKSNNKLSEKIMKNIPKLLFIVTCLYIFWPAGQGEAQTQLNQSSNNSFTLQQLIDEALHSNPAVQAAQLKSEAYQNRIPQAASLPDPMFSLQSRSMGNPLPFVTLGNSQLDSFGFMASQDIPYPGKLKLKTEAVKLEALSIEQDIESVKLDLIANIKSYYYDYLLADEKLRILENNNAYLEQFEKITQARYSVGEGIMQDVLKAQTEISINFSKIIEMKKEKDNTLAQINALINRHPSTLLKISGNLEQREPLPDFQSLMEIMKKKNPQLKAMNFMIESNKKELQLEKKGYYPDFQVSAGYGYSRNFDDMWEINFGISLPVFYKTKQNNAIIEAAKKEQTSTKSYENMFRHLQAELKNAHLTAQLANDLLNLYAKTVIPQAKSTMESAMSNYEVGTIDFLAIIDNLIIVLDFQMKYYEQLTAYQKALATIDKLIGNEE
ncbi:MAG: hypothetical protein A2Y62_01915 [Candidatus Fischerbacteria bacterium RBG_13_37_8]|uniref:Transporter n=1 Tax=Candidatus Fischerbacteria bacterium RBG_13_37_8 TaxID=1817863 RepID=A0A1F5VJJ0_9BACT|nr:MAG: hypothetical protein A2Y62_01915 [Candidatus Fischerbacteria bacterium RBG_13_37_8]